MTKNLWGTLPDTETIRTPYTVLREQATLLGEMSKGQLIGKVERYSVLPKSPFVPQQGGELKLLMVAPALNNYSYVVVTVIYPVTAIYPVTVVDNSKNDKPVTCHSEEELLQILETILSSERTRQVIASLLVQIQADKEEYEIPF